MSAISHVDRSRMLAEVVRADFTQMPNRVFRDPRISARAMGVFAHLATRDFDVSLSEIASEMLDSEDVICEALEELQGFGYIDLYGEGETPAPTTLPGDLAHTPTANRRPPVRGFVYVMECGGFHKIGWSEKPHRRLQVIRVGNPFPVTLLGVIEGGISEETRWHKVFAPQRKDGEWYALTKSDLASMDLSAYQRPGRNYGSGARWTA